MFGRLNSSTLSIACIGLLLTTLPAWAGCENGGTNDAQDGGGDAGSSDTDVDSDTATDPDACNPTADWGSGDQLVLGESAANWNFFGIFDGNGDGTIDNDEQTSQAFTLEDIFCAGKNSVVIIKSEMT